MSDIRYAHIMSRLIDTPLLLYPPKARLILDVMLARMREDELDLNALAAAEQQQVSLLKKSEYDSYDYELVHGIAVISIDGAMVHKLGGCHPYSGMLGYDSVLMNIRAALEDDEARGIFLVVNCPGGEVSGAFDACDALFNLRGQKPVWAVVDEMACSSGYAIPSSIADRILTPRTAMSGSIGVFCMHLDMSNWLSKEGLKPTFIQYGARKVDGAPELPLSPEAQSRMQDQVNAVGKIFIETVARNRKLKASAIKAQEAGVFQGEDAVTEGLCDAVMSAEEAFAEFHEFVSGN